MVAEFHASPATAEVAAARTSLRWASRWRAAAAVALSVLCGAILAIPFRSYEGSGPVWFALAPVMALAANARSRRRAALYASAFALTWTWLCLSFLWNPAAPGAIALSIFSSLFYVIGLLIVRRVARDGPMPAVIGIGCVWVLIEVARSLVPVFGFPWLLLGHTLLYDPHLRQGADIFGVYGLSFIIAAVNACLAFAFPLVLPARAAGLLSIHGLPVPHKLRLSAWRALSVTASLVLGAFCYGVLRCEQIGPRLAPGARIGVVQGNVVQKLNRSDDEVTAQLIQHIELHRKLLSEAAASGSGMPELVCWAETMVPNVFNNGVWGQKFMEFVASTGIPAITGSNYVPPEDVEKPPGQQRIYNAAFLIDGQGHEVFHAFKRKLVAFGEYVPFTQWLPLLKSLRSVTLDQYSAGTEASPVREVAGYRIAFNVCVEDIHPDIARELSYAGADTLINITNDGWFYKTYGPQAHLRAAAWRAIEVRRPLLRVTNTGMTVAVDPLGHIDVLVPPETEGTAIAQLQRIRSTASLSINRESGVGSGAENVSPFAAPRTIYMVTGEVGVGLIFISILFGCLWIGAQNPPENL